MVDRDLLLFGGLFTASLSLLGTAVGLDAYRLHSERLPAVTPAPAQAPAAAPSEPVPPSATLCSPEHYEISLAAAARTYRVPPVPVEVLRRPLAGGVEFHGARVLAGRHAALETGHLTVKAAVTDLAGPDGSQAVPHLTLSIENKTDVPLAYRVLTRVPHPDGCEGKHDLPHNALVLRPHQAVQRSECGAQGRKITVTLVEVYEVSPLGAVFLSRLQPHAGGTFDMRVAAAHDRGGLPQCAQQWLPLDPGRDEWRRMIDFYARHDCDEYSLPADYLPWDQPGALPACDPGAQAQR